MNMHLYPKLAWHGIIKNKKTYVPFLLTSIGLVMMFYIVSYLTYNKSVKQMRGGGDMQLILSWGVPVVAFFVVIFLFYMNSFLMRRRKTEFGLYNILGMGKGNIARVLLWQNLMLFAVSIVGGLGMGILLSKLAELCAAKMLSNQASLAFVIEPSAVRNILFLTVLSFVLILLYSLGQIRVAKPIELLHGEKTGEKPPKARWILALLHVIAGYRVLSGVDHKRSHKGTAGAVYYHCAGHYRFLPAVHLRLCGTVQAAPEKQKVLL